MPEIISVISEKTNKTEVIYLIECNDLSCQIDEKGHCIWYQPACWYKQHDFYLICAKLPRITISL